MIILDTNVLSTLMNQNPDANVVAWLDRQPRSSVWTTSITVLEVRYGLQILVAGKRRSTLIKAFASLLDKINHRIAAFDTAAAEQASELMAHRRKKGHPVELRDTMIAGIVLARHASLATRNTAHFQDTDIVLLNPWQTA